MPERAEDWWHGGDRIVLDVRDRRRSVFVRTAGTGSVVTLLHGFPASSLEWAQVAARLAERHTVVTFDFLGSGASEKPKGHRYSVFEQADLTEALWRHLAIERSATVGYDYGAIVTQELLARETAGALEVQLSHVALLNASLFVDLYRPTTTQKLATTPVIGALLTRLYNERAFHRGWGGVFSDEHPLGEDIAHEHWVALRAGDLDGDVQRRLLAYIAERKAHRSRLRQGWTAPRSRSPSSGGCKTRCPAPTSPTACAGGARRSTS